MQQSVKDTVPFPTLCRQDVNAEGGVLVAGSERSWFLAQTLLVPYITAGGRRPATSNQQPDNLDVYSPGLALA